MTEPETELSTQENEIAERLDRERPVPAAGFRGALARYLVVRDPGFGPRPARLPAMVCAFLGTGGVLIALAALQATGQL